MSFRYCKPSDSPKSDNCAGAETLDLRHPHNDSHHPMKPYSPKQTGPLHDVRVLDLSRLVAGNMLTVFLADFGADVIKIERADGGDDLRHWREEGEAIYWKIYGRNKRSMTLDLKSADGLATLRKLVEAAHVTVGPVSTAMDLLTHPYALGREAVVDLPDDSMGALPMHNIVPRLSGTPGGFRRPAPKLGEHKAEILAKLARLP